MILCDGKCAEDITEHLRGELEQVNNRGDNERLFDEMNNDFVRKKMPCSFYGCPIKMDKARQATYIKIIYCQEIPSVIRMKRHKQVTIMGLMCFYSKHKNLPVSALNIEVARKYYHT
ncbi:MAG: hypothetical protein R6U95_09745 [Bacteroidales bacterium]